MKFSNINLFLLIGLSILINLIGATETIRKVKTERKQVSVGVKIFNDNVYSKLRTQFDDVTYHIKNENDVEIGVMFQLANTYDKSNSEKFINYFTSIDAHMPTRQSAVVLFSNILDCNIKQIKQAWYIPDPLGIPIIDNQGKLSYIQLSYSITTLDERSNFLKSIIDACKKNIGNIRSKLDQFYQYSQKYFEMKTKLQNLKKRLIQAQEEMQKNAGKNEELDKSKKGYQVQIDLIIEKKNKANKEMLKMEKLLADKYTEITRNKEELSLMEKNLTNLNENLNKTNNISNFAQSSLDTMKKQSDDLRIKRTNLTNDLLTGNSNLSKIETKLTSLKSELDSSIKDSLDLEKIISQNQLKISSLNNIISQDKDNLDKDARNNLPDNINKTIIDIDQLKKLMNIAYNKTEQNSETLTKNSKEIEKLNNEKKEALTDTKLVEQSNKEDELFVQTEIKDAVDMLRKNFPQISEIYVNNVFEFCQNKYPEAFNYIYAIRPSKFSLYSKVYLTQKAAMKKILRRSLFFKNRLARRQIK